MEATLKDIRDEWFEYIKEVETAARECEELKVRNKSLEVEIAKLKEELINRSIETAKLNASLTASADKIAKFYSQRVKSVQDSVKEISAQNQLEQQKYESEIQSSRINALERELFLHKNERERLQMENQNLKRHRIVSANNY